MFRSVVAELPDLQDGTYSIVVKVVAKRNPKLPSVEEVVEKMCRDTTDRYHEKFSQAGLSYNVAHSKGAGIMEARIRKRKGEEKRKAWKQRHEEQKRHVRKYMKREKINRATFLDPIQPKAQKTERIEIVKEDSVAKQPRRRVAGHVDTKLIRATTLPAMRRTDRAESSTAQGRTEIPFSTVQNIPLVQEPEEILPSIAENVSLLEEPGEMPPPLTAPSQTGHPTQHHAIQTEVVIHPHHHEGRDIDQEEGSAASSEYHTDTDSINSFCPSDDYRRLSYDPPRNPRPKERPDPFDEGDDDIVDPWNALCMVGLRVYSKDPDLRIEVVMPGEGEKPGLDIDDKQAGVPVEVPPEGRELPIRRLKRAFTSPVVRKSEWGSS